MAGALTLPAKVLQKHHKKFLRSMMAQDSEAFNDLVSDGVVLLVGLDKRLPAGVGAEEFRMRAVGHLMLYYRRRFRKFLGQYANRAGQGTKQRKVPVHVGLAGVDDQVSVLNTDLAFQIEVEDFLEGVSWDEDVGTLSPSDSSWGGRLARRRSA